MAVLVDLLLQASYEAGGHNLGISFSTFDIHQGSGIDSWEKYREHWTLSSKGST